jgi:hypothetical protein
MYLTARTKVVRREFIQLVVDRESLQHDKVKYSTVHTVTAQVPSITDFSLSKRGQSSREMVYRF